MFGEKMKKLLLSISLLIVTSFNASAGLITGSQNITSTGQNFSFTLPEIIGVNGLLEVTFSGDFNEDNKNEFLLMSFDNFATSVSMAESGVTNVAAVTGLNLIDFTAVRIFKLMDSTMSATFSLSNDLLASLSNSVINFDATAGVEDWFDRGTVGTDADYVAFKLSFDAPQASSVSAPGILGMLGLALVALGLRRKGE